MNPTFLGSESGCHGNVLYCSGLVGHLQSMILRLMSYSPVVLQSYGPRVLCPMILCPMVTLSYGPRARVLCPMVLCPMVLLSYVLWS